MAANTGITNTVDKAGNYMSSSQQNSPFLGQEGTNIVDTTGGIWKGVTGDKSGWKQAGNGVWNSLTAKGLRQMNNPPPQSFYGGSADAMQGYRDQFQGGIGMGQGYMGQGFDTIGAAGQQAVDNRGVALGMLGQGGTIGAQGLAQQQLGVQGMNTAVNNYDPSVAQALLAQGSTQVANQMRSAATEARGGNQAAAMRNANDQGAQMGLDMAQRAAVLRAQEEAQRTQQRIGAAQAQAQFGANQAGLGYGLQGQALGLAGQSTGQLGSLGSTQGQLGLGTQDTYLGALNNVNNSQLEADTKWSSAKKAAQGGILGMVGNVIGSVAGG